MNKIHHTYLPEILIPFVAIENNLKFIIKGSDEYVTSDDIHVTAKYLGSVNAFSQDAIAFISSVYNMSVCQYLIAWHERCGDGFDSLELLKIKLEYDKKRIGYCVIA